MDVAVERDRVVERVHAEAVLGESRNVRPEETAARSGDQAVVGQSAALVTRADDVDGADLGVDHFDAPRMYTTSVARNTSRSGAVKVSGAGS